MTPVSWRFCCIWLFPPGSGTEIRGVEDFHRFFLTNITKKDVIFTSWHLCFDFFLDNWAFVPRPEGACFTCFLLGGRTSPQCFCGTLGRTSRRSMWYKSVPSWHPWAVRLDGHVVRLCGCYFNSYTPVIKHSNGKSPFSIGNTSSKLQRLHFPLLC